MTVRGKGATTPAARLHGLDTLRAVAILWVMPFHLRDHFPAVLRASCRFGWMGVDLFFVLSGYLIAAQLFRQQLHGPGIRLGAFYRRRAYRILPAYLVVLLLYVVVPAWREAPGMQPAWQFATFTENLLIDYAHNQAFSHAWSLCVEEHFYLLFPLLALLCFRRPATWKGYTVVAAVFLFGIAVRGWVVWHVLRPMGVNDDRFGVTYIEKLYYPTWTRLDGLLAGVSLALMEAYRPRWWAALRRHGHALALVGVALVAVEGWCWLAHGDSLTGRGLVSDVVGYPMLGMGFALLVASALSEGGLLARVKVPGAKLLATLAFALYLTHKEAVHLLFAVFPQLPDEQWRTLAIFGAACLLVAGVLHATVERPFLRLRAWREKGFVSEAQIDTEMRVDPAI